MIKRIILMVTVALVMALVMTAGPAFATVTGTNIGQPVFAVTPEGEPLFPGAPFVGTNPSADGASGNAVKPDSC